MKFKLILLVFIFAAGTFSCKKYLNINSDPTSPQTPDLASLMIPATSIMSKIGVLDVVSIGNYTQNWSGTGVGDQFDTHGGNNSTGSVANALWRSFYAQQGQNINLVIAKGTIEQRWDYVGAATALRAWGLMMATQYFGEMPYHEAWKSEQYTFAYDMQEEIYKSIDSLCVVALDYLQRTDGAVNSASMARGDRVYAGDRSKWIKFVYGLRARHWQHLSNKSNYNADSVIYFVDRSFAGNADNFLVTHTATRNDDTNPMGPGRTFDNFSTRRQSRFIVQLLDGTNFYGTSINAANRDPRLRGMLSASPDTTTTGATMPTLNGGYRFLTPSVGDANSAAAVGSAAFRQRPSTFYGDSAIVNPANANFAAGLGKYLWRNSAPYPIMTYHELQFIKAEAAFLKGNSGLAHTAYLEGISKHFDFVDFFNAGANPSVSPIAPQRAAYLASAAVKPSSATLTLTDIMLQKYIGDFAWNLIESWSDMRRYHYFDVDPLIPTQQVYRGYLLTVFSSNNQGPKPANRYRPTNFSEFDWNFEELRKLGVGNIDYHTYEMWFSQN